MADELDARPAAVALSWLLTRPGVTAPLIGARSAAQLEENLAALEIALTPAQIVRLDAVSEVSLGFPHDYLQRPAVRANIDGGIRVEPR